MAGLWWRVVTIPPGRARPYVGAEWRDAVVVVRRGRVGLEGVTGRRDGFGAGAVLHLTGVPLRALHNEGTGPVVLVAHFRAGARTGSPPPTGPRSWASDPGLGGGTRH
jgi:hypothetical protein